MAAPGPSSFEGPARSNGRNGYHGADRLRPHAHAPTPGSSSTTRKGSMLAPISNSQSHGASGQEHSRSTASDEDDQLDEDQHLAGGHQHRHSQPILSQLGGLPGHAADDEAKGLFSWIRRFTSLGRRTQSSIDVPSPQPEEAEVLKAELPRRSYSEADLGPRRRVACEYVRPSNERKSAAFARRSAESAGHMSSGSEDQYGRPSAEETDYADIMKRRRKAYESLFANENSNVTENHFLNDELAARSSLFNSGN